MSFVQLTAITIALIVLLILFFSNLAPALPLVFLGQSTIPIPIGLLWIGAFSAGLLTSLLLRLLMFWQRPRPERQRPPEPADFSYQPEQPPRDDWETSRPDGFNYPEVDRDYNQPRPEPPERFREPERFSPEQFDPEPLTSTPPSDYVYDADYRVINPPQPDSRSTPVVGSKLSPDSEDWGFDFDDEDEPRTRR